MRHHTSSSTTTSAEAVTSTKRSKVMILEETIKKLLEMKMRAMADALRELVSKPPGHGLSFEEQLGVLVDCEWTDRHNKALARRLKAAKLRGATIFEGEMSKKFEGQASSGSAPKAPDSSVATSTSARGSVPG